MSFEVEVDAWENQRYKPFMTTWSEPFMGEVPHFSDIQGSIRIPSETKGKESIPMALLPSGWQWSSDWTVDNSDRYGGCDENGWSYAPSFETLFKRSISRTSVSEMSHLSLARRRRWVVRRKCVGETERKAFQEKIAESDASSLRRQQQFDKKEKDYLQVLNYESSRQQAFQRIVAESEISVLETVNTLEVVLEKLELMKAFLVERGNLESMYAQNLSRMADRWKHAGITKQPAVEPKPSIQENGSVIPEDQEDACSNAETDNTSQANSGFFYLLSTASGAVAKESQSFSISLVTILPTQVDSVIADANYLLRECRSEGPNVRASLRNHEKLTFRAFLAYQTIYMSCKADLSAENGKKFASFFYASAADEFLAITNNSESGSSEKRKNSTKKSSWSFSSNSSASSTTPENEGTSIARSKPPGVVTVTVPVAATPTSPSSVQSSIVINDLWLALQKYHQHVSDAEAELLLMHAFAIQQRKQQLSLAAKVQALIQSTIKTFRAEQLQLWNDVRVAVEKIIPAPGNSVGGDTDDADACDFDGDFDAGDSLYGDFDADDDFSSVLTGRSRSNTGITNATSLTHGTEYDEEIMFGINSDQLIEDARNSSSSWYRSLDDVNEFSSGEGRLLNNGISSNSCDITTANIDVAEDRIDNENDVPQTNEERKYNTPTTVEWKAGSFPTLSGLSSCIARVGKVKYVLSERFRSSRFLATTIAAIPQTPEHSSAQQTSSSSLITDHNSTNDNNSNSRSSGMISSIGAIVGLSNSSRELESSSDQTSGLVSSFWRDGFAVLTYDGVLHLYPVEAQLAYFSNQKSKQIKKEKTKHGRMTQKNSNGEQIVAGTKVSNSTKWIGGNALLSVTIQGSVVEPILFGLAESGLDAKSMLGGEEAIKILLGNCCYLSALDSVTNERRLVQLSGNASATSGTGALSAGSAVGGDSYSISILVEDHDSATEWMRLVTNPFEDLVGESFVEKIDDDYDDEDEDEDDDDTLSTLNVRLDELGGSTPLPSPLPSPISHSQKSPSTGIETHISPPSLKEEYSSPFSSGDYN